MKDKVTDWWYKQRPNWEIVKGKLVIVRSNENEPLAQGILVAFTDHGIPVVRINDQEMICYGIVLPFTNSVWDWLTAMHPIRQYEVLSQLLVFNSAVRSFNAHARKFPTEI